MFNLQTLDIKILVVLSMFCKIFIENDSCIMHVKQHNLYFIYASLYIKIQNNKLKRNLYISIYLLLANTFKHLQYIKQRNLYFTL